MSRATRVKSQPHPTAIAATDSQIMITNSLATPTYTEHSQNRLVPKSLHPGKKNDGHSVIFRHIRFQQALMNAIN
jgi:hypothetical protein